MTDNEIIKALCQCSQGEDAECNKCAYADYDYCHHRLFKDAFDFIQRQQEEIDLLKMDNERMTTKVFEMAMKKVLKEKVRAEAIKEFAEKLKEIAGSSVAVNNGQEIYATKCYNIMAYKLDDLVIEMGCGE